MNLGLVDWNDGGSDCARIASYPNTGVYSIRLRDNSGSSSSLISKSYNLSSATMVNLSFSYYPISMEYNEDFFLEVSTNGGNSYEIIDSWVSGIDFSNNQRYHESLTISSNFSEPNVMFRFRCDASNDTDFIYLDDIIIELCTGDLMCAVDNLVMMMTLAQLVIAMMLIAIA